MNAIQSPVKSLIQILTLKGRVPKSVYVPGDVYMFLFSNLSNSWQKHVYNTKKHTVLSTWNKNFKGSAMGKIHNIFLVFPQKIEIVSKY